MAGDHYLVLQEKELWAKGIKVSNPTLRVISLTDFQSFLEDKFFEKHEITVEILHDPTLGKGGSGSGTALPNKKKEDYVKELASLLEIEVADIDPKLTVKKLQEMIAEQVELKKASSGSGTA